MTWIILRTSPRSTLKLADTLNEAGFECWTPREKLFRGRTRTKAGDEIEAPIMPGFVFGRFDDLSYLHAARSLPGKLYGKFSFFRRSDNMTATIEDRDIGPLRRMEEEAAERHEQKKRRIRKAPAFTAGQGVKVDQSAFTGLEGVVKNQVGADVLVCFGGKVTMKISAWSLLPVDVSSRRDAA